MPSALPIWLAYVAILIDYLELPVIYDTVRRLLVTLRDGGLAGVLSRTPPVAVVTNDGR